VFSFCFMPLTKERAIEHLKEAWRSPDIGKHGPRKKSIEKALDVIFEGKRTVGFKRRAIEKHDSIIETHLKKAADEKAEKDRELYLKNMVYRDGEKPEQHLHLHNEVNEEKIKSLLDEFVSKLKEVKTNDQRETV